MHIVMCGDAEQPMSERDPVANQQSPQCGIG